MKLPVGQKRPRIRDGDYLAFIRTLPCVICWAHPVEACHVRYNALAYGKPITGVGNKPDDRWTVPMCHEHHSQQHANGERLWWIEKKIDPLAVAALIYSHWTVDDLKAARQVIMSAYDIGRGYP
jgi:hypothetical protein